MGMGNGLAAIPGFVGPAVLGGLLKDQVSNNGHFAAILVFLLCMTFVCV